MKALQTNIEKKLEKAHATILGGIEQMKAGSVAIVECLDEDREATVKFMKSRGVNDEFLDLIESVGRGRLHPKLLFMPGPGPERLHRAPIKEQERILNTGVQIAKLVGDEFKTTIKPLAELTRAEAEVAIDSSGNVPMEKQVERLKQRIVSHTFKLPAYSLDGDTLLARENCRIPFSELERLYKQAEKAHEKKMSFLEGDIKRKQIAK